MTCVYIKELPATIATWNKKCQTIFQFFSEAKWLWPHLFIKELGKKFNKDDTKVIAENKEKYNRFSVEINVKLAGVISKYLRIFS